MKTSRLGFITSGLTYLGLVFLEYLRPGFVANVFSVHWILVVAAVFGVWWYKDASDKSGRADLTLVTFVGLVFAALVWVEGSVFGDARLFIALAALVLPTFTLLALRDTN